MKNSNETSLQIINNNGFLKKIVNFVKALFYKEENESVAVKNKNDFFRTIKYEEDPDKYLLLKIQDDLEKKGINKDNAYELTKHLTEVQKKKLLNLYQEQIKRYEISIENHKRNILVIRRKLV